MRCTILHRAPALKSAGAPVVAAADEPAGQLATGAGSGCIFCAWVPPFPLVLSLSKDERSWFDRFTTSGFATHPRVEHAPRTRGLVAISPDWR
jgi:hypothetical protein